MGRWEDERTQGPAPGCQTADRVTWPVPRCKGRLTSFLRSFILAIASAVLVRCIRLQHTAPSAVALDP
jgi:hypothetical protein